MTLLQVQDLQVNFVARDLDNRVRVARALNGVGFSVGEGEVLGLIGETGAGKSLTALAVMGMLRHPARVERGSVRFAGRELIGLPQTELDRLRGREMAIVVQSPRTSLDPLSRVGEQLVRVQLGHAPIGREEARRRAMAMLEAVGLPDPARRALAWPHELSGGMAQRVLIAMALVNEPRLLIADEPTTGLDVTVQAQILDLLRSLLRARNLAALIITHDLGIVAHYCDRMAVMFAGSIVEIGGVEEVFANPRHPYTRSLIAATPERLELGRSVSLGGAPPDLYALPAGCLYGDRCPYATGRCQEPPPPVDLGNGHHARCHFADRELA
jgi:peptide/nickel transport system ATP-binding protein/oligopeptide transport system ATP-binding protein